MPTYQQNRKAAEKYLAQMDRITFRVPKESGLKDQITSHAESRGESVQQFIIRAILATIKHDKDEPDFPEY